MKKFFLGGVIGAVIVLILLAGLSVASAALTFSGSGISGDSGVVIDGPGSISIGTSTATSITIGSNSSSVSFPGNVSTTNLAITALGASGSPCLTVDAAGDVATTTCGTSGSGIANPAVALSATNQVSTQMLQRTNITFNGMVLAGTSRDYCFGADLTAWATLVSQPNAGNTITIEGTGGTSTTITFVTSGATGNQVNIGSNSYATAQSLYNMLAASTDSNLDTNTYYILNNNEIIIKPIVASGGGGVSPAVSASVPAEWSFYYATSQDCASQRLMRYLGLDPTNALIVAAPGNQACNFLQSQILPNYPGPGSVASWPLMVFGGPINDVTFGGGFPAGTSGATSPPFPYLPTFSTCETAAWTWQGVPSSNKIFGSAFAASGGTCTTDTQFPNVPGETCTTSGTTLTSPSITTTKAGPVYVWLEAIDGDPGAGTVTVGSQVLSWTTALSEPVLTNNGITKAVQLIRFASVPAGTFNVVLNQTSGGTMDLLAVGTPPTGGVTSKPVVLVNDIASQPGNGNSTAVAAYNAQLYSDFATISGDGVGLVLAPESQHVITTPSAGAFQGSGDHENYRIGQKMMFEADLDGLETLPIVTGEASSLSFDCDQASAGTLNLNPGDSCVWVTGTSTINLPYEPSHSALVNATVNSPTVWIINSSSVGTATITGMILGTCPTSVGPGSTAICISHGAGVWENITALNGNTLTLTGTANSTISNTGSGIMKFNVPTGAYYLFQTNGTNLGILQGSGFSLNGAAATSGVNINGPIYSTCGNYWTASSTSASECEYATVSFSVSSGTPTYSRSTFSYNGLLPTLFAFGYSPISLGQQLSTVATTPFNVAGSMWYATDLHTPVWYNGTQTLAVQGAILPGTPTFTAGTNITSVGCASGYTCTNASGELTIVGGTATTGTIATVTYSSQLGALPSLCEVNQVGGATFYGIGHSAPNKTSFTISAGVSVSGATVTADYRCIP